jgi:hypothetical protein
MARPVRFPRTFDLAALPMPVNAAVAEAVAADDAAWFRAHPGVDERVRAFREGEAAVGAPPAGTRWLATLVTKLSDDARLRTFIYVPTNASEPAP